MGNFINLFGHPRARAQPPPSSSSSSSSPSVTSHDLALLELKRQRDRLHRYSLRLDSLIAQETDLAKQLILDHNKPKATIVLRRRRVQQKMREGVESHLTNIERMAGELEWAKVSVDVFKALEKGKEALERMNKQLSIDQVEQMMEENQEAIEEQQRINQLLGGGQWTVSDDEVEAELNKIEAEEAVTTLTPIDLPSPPIRPITSPVTPATSASPPIPARKVKEVVME